VLGEPQRRQAGAHEPIVTMLVFEFGEGLLGPFGLTGGPGSAPAMTGSAGP